MPTSSVQQKHKKSKSNPQPDNPKTLKRKRDQEDLATLQQNVESLDLKATVTKFSELPISQPTQTGLKASHFTTLTDIQNKAIPLALKGRDVLGAAKTGSGKTLTFLVPILDNLYRQKWTEFDGLGALILSPTRELAIQIFEVLRKIGRFHTFSAGLVIGGKSLQEERERLGRMNILVCTPGRILQHMDQTASFEIDNLQMLVLDEADRILDMGFQSTVDAILDHLPKDRQTMLFSATQTRKVGDLARLSLKEPEYVAVHEGAASATPSKLKQNYVVTPLSEKLDTLWSFIRANLKSKIIVFLSSGKQVRFVYECFRQLQPGTPLLHLMGKMKQNTRFEIMKKYASTQHCCLFATDIAARGLDFPAVDWVLQLDCPEDADTYIHRAGRTARYERDGRAVLFLDPSEEEGMLKRLEQKRVPIESIKVKQKKQQSIRNQLQNMCFKDPELKYLGQKAFISYVKSVHLQKDKEIFNVQKLALDEFSASLGLPGAPKIKFMKGDNAKQLKNRDRRELLLDSEDEGSKPKQKEVRTKYDRMFERRNQDVFAEHNQKVAGDDADQQEAGDADEEDGFMTVKRRLSDVSVGSSEGEDNNVGVKSIPVNGKDDPFLINSKRREKMLKSKKQLLKLKGNSQKLVFDDEGNPHEMYELEDEEAFTKKGAAADQRAKFIEEEAERVKKADIVDKALSKEKRQVKKAKRKEREAAEREEMVSESEDGASGQDSGPAPKRAKKWFVDASDDESGRQKKGGRGAVEDAETLDDLEALATSYL